MALKDTVQGFLPSSMQDLWWMVFVWAGLLVGLVVVLVVKMIHKKKGQAASNEFKQQNAPASQPPSGVPADHHQIMQKHNVHKPHDQKEVLDLYITAMLKENVTPELIKTYLCNVGWDAKTVDEALSRSKR